MESPRSLTDRTETLCTEVVVTKGRKTSSNTCIVKTCTVRASRPNVVVASLVNSFLDEIRVPMDANNAFLRRHNVEKLVDGLKVPEHALRQENDDSRVHRVEQEGMAA